MAALPRSGRSSQGPMCKAVAADSRWFARHPDAVVRFRPMACGEFRSLTQRQQYPPVFVPPGVAATAPLSWVAVVHLTRILDPDQPSTEGSIRARIRTVPMRSRRLQAQMVQVFAEAVCRDFLAELQGKGAGLVQSA